MRYLQAECFTDRDEGVAPTKNRGIPDMKINHLINGQSVAGSDYFETVNPATQEVLAEVASGGEAEVNACLLYTSPSPRDRTRSRMPSSA